MTQIELDSVHVCTSFKFFAKAAWLHETVKTGHVDRHKVILFFNLMFPPAVVYAEWKNSWLSPAVRWRQEDLLPQAGSRSSLAQSLSTSLQLSYGSIKKKKPRKHNYNNKSTFVLSCVCVLKWSFLTTSCKSCKNTTSPTVELTICLHSRCRISENKMAALPAGSSGLLNSLQTQNKSSLDAKLNHTDSCARREPGITASTVHRQTVKVPALRKMKSLLRFFIYI